MRIPVSDFRGVFGWGGGCPGLEETRTDDVLVRLCNEATVANTFAQDGDCV